eukprot:scaffold860_cov111-Cylindrotheca_fusiformis.AAC.7
MQHPEVEDVVSIYYTGQKEVIPATVRRIKKIAEREKLNFVLYQGLEKEEEEEVGIPSTVKVMFYQCRSLARLGLKEGLERIGKVVFRECESLTKVDFPSTIKVIDDLAFWKCKHLERLSLNEGLERIGEYAFCECESLTEVHVPSTLKMIGNGAFQTCKLLTRLVVLKEGRP